MRMESHRGFANAVAVRALTIDDMSAVRYMHSLSLRCLTGLGEDEIEALTAEIQSPEYTDRLMTGRILLGWLERELVGSVGWSARDAQAAEITSVFVHPLFTRCGIGRQLIRTAEAEARALGFSEFSVPVTPDAAGFFERLGYRVASRRRNRNRNRKGTALPFAVARRVDRTAERRVPARMAHA